MKRVISLLLLCAAFISLGGCVQIGERQPLATIEFSDGGTIRFLMYPKEAPNTVANFISLANSGFYDGSPVHRIEEYFVIQMGKSGANGDQNAGYKIKGEFPNNGFSRNTVEHMLGTVSMARAPNDYDSASSQFFICTRNQLTLNGDYAAFGRITETESLNELMKISKMDIYSDTKEPRDEIYIVSVRVETYGKDYGEPKKVK